MAKFDILIKDTTGFLTFLKSRSHIYHCSNVFFRDFQYGIMTYAQEIGMKISYAAAEELARELIDRLTEIGILRAVKPGSWMLNYESFRKPAAKSAATPNVASATARQQTAVASTT